jgi:Tfp pilus assembly protein PilF
MSRREIHKASIRHPKNNIFDWPKRGPAGFVLWFFLFGLTAAVVFWAHWPALTAQAICFDDQQYLTENPLVLNPSWASAKRFVVEVRVPSTVRGYYQPLNMVSLMLDCAMGGRSDHLGPFHQTSLTLHVINTLLIIVLLNQLFGNPWIAAIVALLFGLHPLTVETIPWIGERKTLLAAFFSFIGLIAYICSVNRKSEIANGKSRLWYTLSFVCYFLALLSKPTSVPLPLCMLLLDYWPLRRLNWRAVTEKIPFLLLGLGAAVITFISQRDSGAVTYPTNYAPLRIPLILCHNIVFYMYKMIWPTHLTAHYAMPDPLALSNAMVLIGVIGTCVLIPALFISLRWTRAWMTGWLFFFVAIFPTLGVIGFTNVIASDKYAYLPSFGVLMVLAYWLSRAWNATWPYVLGCIIVGGILLGSLEATGTRSYLAVWQSTEKLYIHMLQFAPRAAILYNNLGNALLGQGRTDEAIANFSRALELKSENLEAHHNLANALARKGRVDEAIQHYYQALKLNPNHVETLTNLAAALANKGQIDEAITHFRHAAQLRPDNAKVHYNLALALSLQGKPDQAIDEYREVLRIDPGHEQARRELRALSTQPAKVK